MTIAAYNKDLETGLPVIGQVVTAQVHTSGATGWLIPVAVAAMLLALGGFGGGYYVYRRKRAAAAGTSNASFLYINDNNS